MQNPNAPALTPDNYDKQEAFLASSQPENAARTFLEHSGLIGLLRNYGLELGTAAENDNGVITFRGTGSTAQSECSVRFSFLYTGDFNQAVPPRGVSRRRRGRTGACHQKSGVECRHMGQRRRPIRSP